jgi:hypothetical protein
LPFARDARCLDAEAFDARGQRFGVDDPKHDRTCERRGAATSQTGRYSAFASG